MKYTNFILHAHYLPLFLMSLVRNKVIRALVTRDALFVNMVNSQERILFIAEEVL